MKSLAFVNQKGGVGKSVLSVNKAHYLAEQKLRVLFGDADEQGNSSKSLAQYAVPGLSTSALFSNKPLKLPATNQQIVLLKGDDSLREIEKSTKDDEELVNILRKRLEEISQGFDYAVFDTAGANSRVANAFLVASNFVVVPCRIDPYSVDVAATVLKRILFIQKKWNPSLVNLGILANEYDANSPAQNEWLKDLMSNYGKYILGAYVPKRSAFREASGLGVPVWRLESETEDETKGKIKSSARTAGREIKAVFKLMQEKMENSHG